MMKNKRQAYKKNQILKLTITDITDLGFGVGRIDDMVVFVCNTVPGDVVEVKIIKVNASYLIGRVEKFIEKSSLRVSTRCNNSACRSCAYKNLSYIDEAKLKEEKVRRIFSSGGFSKTPIKINPIVTSLKETRYRNKAQYPIDLSNGEYKIGFYSPKSHRVTEVFDCPLTPKLFSKIILELKDYFKENSISVYDEKSGKGLLRHIYLRYGEVSGEILLTLVINGREITNSKNLVSRITEKFPKVVGILLNVNTENTNVVLGKEYITLYGRDFIFDTLSGVKLKITAPSFYQVNRECCELLYSKAKELAKPNKDSVLLDLFCGAGSIGLSMAHDVKELIGIEIVESAVMCAEENAKNNGIDNAKFYTGNATETKILLNTAEKERGEKINPDIIVLDPPRSGIEEDLIDFICKLNPKRIVYISCNPKTLARDVLKFAEYSYKTDSITPFDMFPMTGHVESICLMQK